MDTILERFLQPLDTQGGSPWPHFALPMVQIVALALPPFRGRAVVFVPLILACVYLTWHNLFMSNPVARGALVAQWPWYMGTIGRLLFTKPEEELWRKDQTPKEAPHLTFLSKLRWSAGLYCSPRGIGWNFQVKGVPQARRTYTRKAFIWSCIKWLALCWLCLDIVGVYMMRRYYKGHPDVRAMPSITLDRRFGAAERLFDMLWATAGMIYFPIQNMYYELALVSVVLGSSPQAWPPIYGRDLRQITTIRSIWNTFWHQIIRNTFTLWSHGLMQALHISHGTWLSAYFQLYFSFFFTGIGHALVTYALSYQIRNYASFAFRFWPWLEFYLMQAIGIHFEDFIWWCYTKVVTSSEVRERQISHRRVFGWIWVAAWWTWHTDAAMLVYFRTGLAAESPLPFSLCNILLKQID